MRFHDDAFKTRILVTVQTVLTRLLGATRVIHDARDKYAKGAVSFESSTLLVDRWKLSTMLHNGVQAAVVMSTAEVLSLTACFRPI